MIGLIINHPKRDQPQFINLINSLKSQSPKLKLILIPLGNEAKIIREYKNELDMIVFNFIRKENLDTILLTKTYNIKTVVYEQEGAGGNDGLGSIKSINETLFFLPFIDHYIVWGTAQMKYYFNNKKFFFHPKKISNVGCMRFDAIKNIKPQNVLKKKYICVNTNFPFISPRYNSVKKEFYNRIENRDENFDFVKQKYDLELARKKEFFKVTEKLVNHYKNLIFVIRPHPMEKANIWKYFSKYKNCRVLVDSSSIAWAKKTECLIHINSSSSVEASYIKIPSISLNWLINDDNIPTFLPTLTSIKSNNYEDLKIQISKIIYKKKQFNLMKKKQKIFNNFYGPSDFSTHKRLAKLLLKIQSNKSNHMVDILSSSFFLFLRIKKKLLNFFKKNKKMKKKKVKKNLDYQEILSNFKLKFKIKKIKNSILII